MLKTIISHSRIRYRNLAVDTKEKYKNLHSTHHHANFNHLSDPLFIVSIPGSLHIVDLCLRFVPASINVVLVANGLDPLEQRWAEKNLKVNGILKIKSCVRHGTVLNILFNIINKPFGILDYDCFIFNQTLFRSLITLDRESAGNGLFKYTNPELNLDYPETFALFFNTEIIRKIIKDYQISCNQYHFFQLSNRIRQRLSGIGIDETHYPEKFKKVFDTLRLVLSLVFVHGYRFNFVTGHSMNDMPAEEAFHVGGVSLPGYTGGYYQWRGSYFWSRALENNPDEKLRSHYQASTGCITSEELSAVHPRYSQRAGPKFFDLVEEIITSKVER